MGFFSWITQDTNRSISNRYSGQLTFPVTMSDNNGNKWTENFYEGYGIFDDKDYYDLLAEMNGYKAEDFRKNLDLRTVGIALASHAENGNWGKRLYNLQFDDIKPEDVLFPNLNEDSNVEWRKARPLDCEKQGFF